MLLLATTCTVSSALAPPPRAAVRMSMSTTALSGLTLSRVADGEMVDIGKALEEPGGPTLCVFGTYPADFNCIEYCQRLRHYMPTLTDKGVSRFIVIANGGGSACSKLQELVDLPDGVELLSDPAGEAGRRFSVSRGWLADDSRTSAYVKLFGMLVGLGAHYTLPSVLTGYFGNPSGKNGWIESALVQGTGAGRFPTNAVFAASDGKVVNKFDDLPVVGGWGRRPLELATLRLQNMVGISLSNWEELRPDEDRCLTQLGGLVLVDGSGKTLYEWRDNGICAVANFEEVVAAL